MVVCSRRWKRQRSVPTTLKRIRSVMGGLGNLTHVDRYLFVAVKVALVCLAYLSFHMVSFVGGR